MTMNICVHTRPRLLLTASVSRLERRSQGLSMKRHLLMGNSKIEFILSKHPIPQHHTAHQSIWRPHHPALIAPLHMIPQIWLLRLKNSQRPYVGGWLISLSSPFSPKEKKKKSTPKRLSSSSITAGETQEKVALSFPCVTTRALPNYSP